MIAEQELSLHLSSPLPPSLEYLAGEAFIGRTWQRLSPNIRDTLVASARFNQLGQSLDYAKRLGSELDGFISSIGILEQCDKAELQFEPTSRYIPSEASDPKVITAVCAMLLSQFQEPALLRLGLSALAQHECAKAMFRMPPRTLRDRVEEFCFSLSILMDITLVLAIAPALAWGIAAAVNQQIADSSFAFFVVGLGVMGWKSIRSKIRNRSSFTLEVEQLLQWMKFRAGGIGINGRGALENLLRMQKLGIEVPSLAFDLAETLRRRSLP